MKLLWRYCHIDVVQNSFCKMLICLLMYVLKLCFKSQFYAKLIYFRWEQIELVLERLNLSPRSISLWRERMMYPCTEHRRRRHLHNPQLQQQGRNILRRIYNKKEGPRVGRGLRVGEGGGVVRGLSCWVWHIMI